MSDSDDTDFLLLIPPNFFITDPNLDDSLSYERFETHLHSADMDQYSYDKPLTRKCHGNNSFSTPSSKVAVDPFSYQKYTNPNGSFNSCYTPNTTNRYSERTSPAKLAMPLSVDTFQPKSPQPYGSRMDGSVLGEIDNYLEKCSISQTEKFNGSTLLSTPKHSDGRSKSMQTDIMHSLSAKKMSQWDAGIRQSLDHNDQLISMANVWDGKERSSDLMAELEEEKLRRRQCERSIQSLQNQLRQCQSKYSDAIQMDQSKNEAMAKLHQTNSSLIANINDLERQLSDMELKVLREKESLNVENNDLKKKIQRLHQQNVELERKTGSLLKSTNEVRDIHQKQLDEMEIRLSNAKQSETLLIDELSQLKGDHLMKTAEHEKEKNRVQELEKQIVALSQSFTELQFNEKTLSKEIEAQKSALKSFYQSQLDSLVKSKVDEYQKQLDAVEGTLRKEAKHIERTIAERAVKQIELINQKNEQEFELLEEKHREEMELAKIRLENATKTIVQLEEELSVYRAKRSDIADRLHKVIETQWQKTLEIIASDASADSNQPPANNNCNPRKNNDLFNVIEHEINRRNSFSKCDNVNIHTAQHNKTKKHLNNSID